MRGLWVHVQGFLVDRSGQGMVEYAMIIGMVAIGVFTLLGLMGVQVFQAITAALQTISLSSP
jgi:Flp pilus assembly pilin Flp